MSVAPAQQRPRRPARPCLYDLRGRRMAGSRDTAGATVALDRAQWCRIVGPTTDRPSRPFLILPSPAQPIPAELLAAIVADLDRGRRVMVAGEMLDQVDAAVAQLERLMGGWHA